MQNAGPSRTAMAVARHRAAHQVLEQGRIFRDPLALQILGLGPQDIVRDAQAGDAGRGVRFFVAARTEFAESRLAEGVTTRGVSQVVVLGAGLDTFAYRHDHGDRLRVFEVDHPASQAWKRSRLTEAAIQTPRSLVFTPVDFERDDLADRLIAAGFLPDARTFFVWLGVVPYLTLEAVQSMLRFIGSLPGGAEVAFDYSEPSAKLPKLQRERHEGLAAMVASVGEPFLTYFEPSVLRGLLEDLGFSTIDDLSVRALGGRFFGPDAPGVAALPDRGGHVVHAATT